jgi:ElaB/YqjD/DUF883 family membrane-anchored ribosome-binding protein
MPKQEIEGTLHQQSARNRGSGKFGVVGSLFARQPFHNRTKTCAEEEMVDRQRARDTASDAVGKAGKAAGDAASQARAAVQSTLEQGKSMAQDLARQASGFGRQAMDRAGEVIQGVAPRAGEQAKQAASNLYDQGSHAGEHVRQYVVQQPLSALLIAGAIGYALAYMIHRR